MSQLTTRQQIYHDRLNTDFPFFSRWSLKIKTKAGMIEPFILNKAQEYLHKIAEWQAKSAGKVRILILKGRQQGCSTYIAGRFYWRTTRNTGKSTFILSHHSDTTEKLFQMVERFQKFCPEPVRAEPDIANRRRLSFANINSEYFVGTAGNEQVGRGGTVQFLHASEAAYYPDGTGFSTGLLQSVPDVDGTEVFIESTANGMDPLFYSMCMTALAGKGEYILVFIPWFWQEEYRKKCPPDFVPTKEEAELALLHGLDNEQLMWRRNKIIDLGSGGEKLFMQEYPNTPEEAFITSGESLILSLSVLTARKSFITDPWAPLVMGVDPNEAAGRAAIAFRRGREMLPHFRYENRKPMEFVGIIANFLDSRPVVKCFIDTGNGYGIVDRLIELGYDKQVIGVSFGEGAIEENLFLNKRAEIWCLMRDWFLRGGCKCPDEDLLHREFCCVPALKKTSSGLIKLESKDKIIEDTKVHPDSADAFALTFSYPVATGAQGGRKIRKVERRLQSSLKSINRREGIREHAGSASAFVKFP